MKRAIFDRVLVFGVFDAFGVVLLGAERRVGDPFYRRVQRVVRIGAFPSRGASRAFVSFVMVFLLPVICHGWMLPGD